MTVQYNGKQVQATVTDEVGIVLSALPWRVLRDVIFSAQDAAVTKRRAELSAKQRQLEGMQNALYAFGLRGSV